METISHAIMNFYFWDCVNKRASKTYGFLLLVMIVYIDSDDLLLVFSTKTAVYKIKKKWLRGKLQALKEVVLWYLWTKY